MPVYESNRRQQDPPDQCDSQKPVVPICLAKEILQKRFEAEEPAHLPSQHMLGQIHDKEAVEPGVNIWPKMKPALLNHWR